MARVREDWQDSAKGIAILLVVLGHAIRGLIAAGIGKAPVWAVADFTIYTFHMPLMMFLAGLNVPHSLLRGRRRFVRSKILGLLWPYILWSIILGGTTPLFAQLMNHPTSWAGLTEIAWRPYLWFLYALFVFMLLAAIIEVRWLVPIAIVAFLAAEPPFWNAFIQQLLHFLLFFVAGMLVGRATEASLAPIRRHPLLALGAPLLVFAAAVAASVLLHFISFNSVLMLPAAIAGTIVCVAIADRYHPAWLCYVGRISLAIYVLHIPFVAGFRIALFKLLHVSATPFAVVAVLPVQVVLGALIPFLIYRLAAAAGLLGYLGFAVGDGGRRWIDASEPGRQPQPLRAPGSPASE